MLLAKVIARTVLLDAILTTFKGECLSYSRFWRLRPPSRLKIVRSLLKSNSRSR